MNFEAARGLGLQAPRKATQFFVPCRHKVVGQGPARKHTEARTPLSLKLQKLEP